MVFAPHVSPNFGGHGLDTCGRAAVFEEAGFSLLGPPALGHAAPVCHGAWWRGRADRRCGRWRQTRAPLCTDVARSAHSPYDNANAQAPRSSNSRRSNAARHYFGRSARTSVQAVRTRWRPPARACRRHAARSAPRPGRAPDRPRPGPAAEAGALVVGERLLDLGLGVHHERPVLDDGLADRAPLQHQHLGAVGRRSTSSAASARTTRPRVARRRAWPPTRSRAREEVERPDGVGPRGAAGSSEAPASSCGSSRWRRPRRACAPKSAGGGRGGASRRRGGPATTVTTRSRDPARRSERARGMSSSQSIVKCGSANLSARREVQPDLEELERVRPSRVEQREHLGVHDAAAGGQPLHVAARRSAPPRRASREWSMRPVADDGHRLEAAVRVLRGSRARRLPWYIRQPSLPAKSWPMLRPASRRVRRQRCRCPRGRRRRGGRRRGRGRWSATGSRGEGSAARVRSCPLQWMTRHEYSGRGHPDLAVAEKRWA